MLNFMKTIFMGIVRIDIMCMQVVKGQDFTLHNVSRIDCKYSYENEEHNDSGTSSTPSFVVVISLEAEIDSLTE